MNPGSSEAVQADPVGTISILGVAVHRVDFPGTLAILGRWVAEFRRGEVSVCRQICTVNPEFIMEARRNPAFAQALAEADLRVPDGVGILWAARLLRRPLRERVTGSDGLYRICERAAEKGWRVYFLGAGPGVAERAAARLQARYPGLEVAGCFAGSPGDADWPAIRERLAQARPDVLFVAYGHPRQDLWIHRRREELPVAVALGVGGAFDFAAGVARRAPRWMRRLGLEWLHRLVTQPWRWRRMRVLPLFVLLVLGQALGVKREA